MKISVINISLGVLLALAACQDENAGQAATARQSEEATPAEVARRVAERPEENTVMVNQLQGTWRSFTDPELELTFEPDGWRGMRYEIISSGKMTEKGTWGSKNDCTECGLTNTDICFTLESEGNKTCCNVVRMDQDTLQYFIVGGRSLKGFVKVKG